MTQLEMLPKTQLDIAKIFLSHFEDEVEKTSKAMLNAQAKVAEALKLREMAEHEVARHAGESVAQGAVDIFNSEARARDTDGYTVTASVGPDVDPITGEVPYFFVTAFYPGDDDPHETQVGDRTRYSELVADYFTAAGLSAEVGADEWGVDALRELTQDGGGYRSLHDVIAPEDYGQELLVVALEQGSVVGARAEVAM